MIQLEVKDEFMTGWEAATLKNCAAQTRCLRMSKGG